MTSLVCRIDRSFSCLPHHVFLSKSFLWSLNEGDNIPDGGRQKQNALRRETSFKREKNRETCKLRRLVGDCFNSAMLIRYYYTMKELYELLTSALYIYKVEKTSNFWQQTWIIHVVRYGKRNTIRAKKLYESVKQHDNKRFINGDEREEQGRSWYGAPNSIFGNLCKWSIQILLPIRLSTSFHFPSLWSRVARSVSLSLSISLNTFSFSGLRNFHVPSGFSSRLEKSCGWIVNRVQTSVLQSIAKEET